MLDDDLGRAKLKAGADLFENGLIINETPDEDGLNTCEDFWQTFCCK